MIRDNCRIKYVLVGMIALLAGGCAAPNQTQLFHAVRSGDVQKVKNILTIAPWLIEAKEPRWGNTPLMEAARYCNPAIVHLLLDRGANVHATNYGGFTPLMIAALNGCHTAIPLLVKKGASVNEYGNAGIAPLHLAAGYPRCVATLLRLGADPLAKDEGGALPIHFAASAQDLASLRLLLQAGNSVNASDEYGRTPLMWMVSPVVWRSNPKECVLLLLRHGADPTVMDKLQGYTVLHHLATFPRTFLEKKDSTAHHVDLQQQEQWRIEIARILIDAGADPVRKDKMGETAAEVAKARGAVHLANFLQQASKGRQ